MLELGHDDLVRPAAVAKPARARLLACCALALCGCAVYVQQDTHPNATDTAQTQPPTAAAKNEAKAKPAAKAEAKPAAKPAAKVAPAKNEAKIKPATVVQKSKPAPAPQDAKPTPAAAVASSPVTPAAAPPPSAAAAAVAPKPSQPVAAAPIAALPGKALVGAPAVGQSHLVIPVRVAFDQAVARMDALIPKTEQEDWVTVTNAGDSPQIDIKYQVWRDPIKASFADQTLSVTVPVRYAATVRAKVQNPLSPDDWLWLTQGETWGTQAAPQQLTATAHVRLSVTDNWQVKSDARLDPLVHGAPPAGDVCLSQGVQLCVSKASMAPQVRARIDGYLTPKLQRALKDASGELDKLLDLKRHAQSLWAALQEPQALQQLAQADCPTELGAACTQPAWLVLQPSALGLTQPKLDGKDLRVDVSIAGQLAAVLGARPVVRAQPFAKLQTLSTPPDIQLNVALRVPTATLGGMLERELAGQRFPAKGKAQLTVKSAQLLAQADPKNPHRINVSITVAGSWNGQLTLSGELKYDAASHVLSVEGFDYTLETQNGLAKQLEHVNHAAFRQQLAERARWDLGAQTGPLRKAVNQALGAGLRDQLQVSGELSELSLRDFRVQADALSAEVTLGGTLAVTYTPK